MGNAACMEMAASLATHCPHIKHLSMMNNYITDRASVLQHLSRGCPALEHLDLGNYFKYFFGPVGQWSDPIRLPQLQHLDVFNMGMSNAACVELAASLATHSPHIKHLNMMYNAITNGASVLQHLSRGCPALEHLNLDGNDISSPVDELVAPVSRMRQMRQLKLYNNPCVKDGQGKEIKQALKHTNPHLDVEIYR